MHITRWTELLGQAGLRESKSRAYNTSTVRPLIEHLHELGLVRLTDDGYYRCQAGLRNLALRWAAGHLDFTALASTCADPYGDDVYHARIALVANRPDALVRLEALHKRDPIGARWIALESTEPLDPTWHASLPPALRARVTELALQFLESTLTSLQGIYRPLASEVGMLGQAPGATASLAGIAILRGELDVARAIVPVEAGLAAALRVALLVVEGRFAEASAEAERLPSPKRGDPAGIRFLLGTFALWLAFPASAEVAHRVAHGAKKGAPLAILPRTAMATRYRPSATSRSRQRARRGRLRMAARQATPRPREGLTQRTSRQAARRGGMVHAREHAQRRRRAVGRAWAAPRAARCAPRSLRPAGVGRVHRARAGAPRGARRHRRSARARRRAGASRSRLLPYRCSTA